MMLRTLVLTTMTVVSTVTAFAQTPAAPVAPRAKTPATAPAAPAAPVPPAMLAEPTPPRPRREGQAINVRVDVTLTDQRGGAPPIMRTLTVIAADGYTGSLRTQSAVFGMNVPVPLNVDASPTLLADGKIRLAVNLQYDWPAAPSDGNSNTTRGTVTSSSVRDQLVMILESGKSMIVAQSADPVGDRQVAVEVKATILK
jgi:hypothetical protein